MDVLQYPSFYAHVVQSLLILYAMYILLTHMSDFRALHFLPKMVIILLFAIVIGIHSLSHLGLEKAYHFFSFRSV